MKDKMEKFWETGIHPILGFKYEQAKSLKRKNERSREIYKMKKEQAKKK